MNDLIRRVDHLTANAVFYENSDLIPESPSNESMLRRSIRDPQRYLRGLRIVLGSTTASGTPTCAMAVFTFGGANVGDESFQITKTFTQSNLPNSSVVERPSDRHMIAHLLILHIIHSYAHLLVMKCGPNDSPKEISIEGLHVFTDLQLSMFRLLLNQVLMSACSWTVALGDTPDKLELPLLIEYQRDYQFATGERLAPADPVPEDKSIAIFHKAGRFHLPIYFAHKLLGSIIPTKPESAEDSKGDAWTVGNAILADGILSEWSYANAANEPRVDELSPLLVAAIEAAAQDRLWTAPNHVYSEQVNFTLSDLAEFVWGSMYDRTANVIVIPCLPGEPKPVSYLDGCMMRSPTYVQTPEFIEKVQEYLHTFNYNHMLHSVSHLLSDAGQLRYLSLSGPLHNFKLSMGDAGRTDDLYDNIWPSVHCHGSDRQRLDLALNVCRTLAAPQQQSYLLESDIVLQDNFSMATSYSAPMASFSHYGLDEPMQVLQLFGFQQVSRPLADVFDRDRVLNNMSAVSNVLDDYVRAYFGTTDRAVIKVILDRATDFLLNPNFYADSFGAALTKAYGFDVDRVSALELNGHQLPLDGAAKLVSELYRRKYCVASKDAIPAPASTLLRVYSTLDGEYLPFEYMVKTAIKGSSPLKVLPMFLWPGFFLDRLSITSDEFDSGVRYYEAPLTDENVQSKARPRRPASSAKLVLDYLRSCPSGHCTLQNVEREFAILNMFGLV